MSGTSRIPVTNGTDKRDHTDWLMPALASSTMDGLRLISRGGFLGALDVLNFAKAVHPSWDVELHFFRRIFDERSISRVRKDVTPCGIIAQDAGLTDLLQQHI